jgi:hypothetical protein
LQLELQQSLFELQEAPFPLHVEPLLLVVVLLVPLLPLLPHVEPHAL